MSLVSFAGAGAIANAAPVATYAFDEGSGTTLHDSAGNHDGTISGATWTASGKYGSALDFDGTNDLVSVSDAYDLDLTSTFTLEAWVKPDALSSWVTAIGKAENPGSPSGYLLAPQVFTKQPGGYVANAGTTVTINASSALPTGTWSHIALTSDGANLRFYVNGELAATKAAITAKATSANLEIGHNQLLNTYFNGLIDEVRVYGEALGLAQIQADRDTEVPTDRNPVAAYSFDENWGGTLHDSAGGHNGTIGGATWTASGKYGSALDFDGTNDLVSIDDAGDLDLTSNFTLEAWVKPDAFGSWVTAISKAENPSSPSGYLLAPQVFTKQPGGYVADTGKSATVNAASALPTGTWSHIALTSDGANLRFYVDGELKTTKAAIMAKATSANLEIGHNQLLNTYFNGLIDEVRVYGETLDQGQIAADKATSTQGPQAEGFGNARLRMGFADNPNLAFIGDPNTVGAVDVDVAIVDAGVSGYPDTDVAGRTDCAHPDHLGNPAYSAPSEEDPNWHPDLALDDPEDPVLHPDKETSYQYGCLDGSGGIDESETHGTALARGIAAIDNERGAVGLAPGARIWSLDTNGATDYTESADAARLGASTYVAALDWMSERRREFNDGAGDGDPGVPISVSNWAVGCRTPFAGEGADPLASVLDCSGREDEIEAAVANAIEQGIVVVAASSNWNNDVARALPAALPDVVATSVVGNFDGVGGGLYDGMAEGIVNPRTCFGFSVPTGEGGIASVDDRRAYWSAWGAEIDVAAPQGYAGGGSSPCVGGGTSSTTASATAAAALLTSRCRPDSRRGVQAIVNTLAAEGTYDWEDLATVTDESGAATGWSEESPDGWKEPLLNVSDPAVFDPKLVGEESSGDCGWLEKPAESDADGDRRADLIAIDAGGDLHVHRGMLEGGNYVPGGFDLAVENSEAGLLDSALLDGEGEYAIDVADVDGDGIDDLTAIDGQAGGLLVRRGRHDRSFEVLAAGPSAEWAMPVMNGSGGAEPVAVADVTGDDRGDAVLFDGENDRIVTAPGRVDGTFAGSGEGQVTSLSGIDSAFGDAKGDYFLDVTDVTGDGLADLVTINTNESLYVFKGKENGSFEAGKTTGPINPIMDDGKGAEPVGLGDVNGDGRADLVTISGVDGKLKLRLGNANATFASPTTPYATAIDSSLLDGEGEELVGLLDYNRDGRADLAAVDEEGHVLTYEAEESGTAFAAPVDHGGEIETISRGESGQELVFEKPFLRRPGCSAGGCSW